MHGIVGMQDLARLTDLARAWPWRLPALPESPDADIAFDLRDPITPVMQWASEMASFSSRHGGHGDDAPPPDHWPSHAPLDAAVVLHCLEAAACYVDGYVDLLWGWHDAADGRGDVAAADDLARRVVWADDCRGRVRDVVLVFSRSVARAKKSPAKPT